MATYYVRKSGNDSNAGTSPGAAWLTIQKAHNAAAGPTGGDIVYIGAGTYREVLTASMTTPTSELQFVGDVDGAHTGDPGPVILTAYTTNDTTTPSTASLISLNSKNFLTYRNLHLIGGSNNNSVISPGTPGHDIKFSKCLMQAGVSTRSIMTATFVVDTAVTWTFDSCLFLCANSANTFTFTAPTSVSADYNLGIAFTNCGFFCGAGASQVLQGVATGANSFKPGGVTLYNCTLMGNGNFQIALGSNWSTSLPWNMYNCILFGNGGVNGGTVGSLVEDYCLLWCATPRSNCNSGAHSISGPTHAFMLEVGQSFLWGFQPRLFGVPMAGSPQSAFGNQGGGPSVDMLGLTRPGTPGIGCLERRAIGEYGGIVSNPGLEGT